jgi:hypothetical protein
VIPLNRRNKEAKQYLKTHVMTAEDGDVARVGAESNCVPEDKIKRATIIDLNI